MITLYWQDEKGKELVTRPDYEGDVFYVAVPRSSATGKKLKLVLVTDAPNSDFANELMLAYG